MKRRHLILALVLLASACSGSDSGGETGSGGENGVAAASAARMVESGDGRATLSLVAGSLPEGVSPDDVQLEVIVDETAEPGAPVVAVQLLPDGLVLTEPATLTIALPEALEGGFMAIHMSGDSIEFLDGDIIQQDDGEFTFQTSIGHFSVVWVTPVGFFEVSLSVNSEEVSVDETQDVAATITARTDPVSLWLEFDSDPDDTVRVITFSAPQPPISFVTPKIYWAHRFWSTKVEPVEVTETPTGWETSLAFSVCMIPNEVWPLLSSGVKFDVTLVSRGEPVPREFAQFSETGEPVPRESRLQVGDVRLLDISPGDTFQARTWLWENSESLCTESGATDTDTDTDTDTKLPPGHDEVGDPKSGSGDSENDGPAKYEPGGDLVRVSHRSEEDGKHTFIIEVDGDGRSLAESSDTQWFDVNIEVVGSQWKANVTYFGGQQQDRGVWTGPNAPGRSFLQGAVSTVTWIDMSTMEFTVDGGGEPLNVQSFTVTIGVRLSDGQTFWDDASGVAES